MMDGSPLIASRRGKIALFLAVSVIVFCFLSLADRAELYFAAGSLDNHTADYSGLIVEPPEGPRFPARKLSNGVLATLFISGPSVGVASIMNAK